MERQRAKIERWLNRIGGRTDICLNSFVDHFFSAAKMDDDQVGKSARTSLSSIFSKMFGSVSASERGGGFHIYTPIGDISDFDEDEQERRREYINHLEECTLELADAIKNTHSHEDALGKSMVKLGIVAAKAYHEWAVTSVESDLAVRERDRLKVSLAMLQNNMESSYWTTREISLWKDFNLTDTMTELISMVDGVKQVMNHSTQTLIMYERAMQSHQSATIRANNLRIQYPSDTPTVKQANEREMEAEREMDLAHNEYTDSCDMATTEMVKYERLRVQGMYGALEGMAQLELDSARARVQELRTMCRRIRSVQLTRDPPQPRTVIGPILWHSAGISGTIGMPSYAAMTPKTSSSSFSSFPMSTGGSSSSHHTRVASASMESSSVTRAYTMDNSDLHSVFAETYEDDYLSYGSRACSPSTAPPSSSTSFPFSADHLSNYSIYSQRTSALPFLGYDPKSCSMQQQKIASGIDESKLEEMAAQAEMEAELVRSGILTATNPKPQKQKQQMPPNANISRGRPRKQSLRHTSSYNSLSTIPRPHHPPTQPVSPSEYLQYSRQNLHSSLTHKQQQKQPHSRHHHHHLRRGGADKGKARATAYAI